MTCGQVLRWLQPLHAMLGAPHHHVCKLDSGHPVSERSGVQVHQCGACTLGWESDPRPTVHCTCLAEVNPRCPTHGTAP